MELLCGSELDVWGERRVTGAATGLHLSGLVADPPQNLLATEHGDHVEYPG